MEHIAQQLNRREEELIGREKKLRAEMQNLRKTHQEELEKKSQKISKIQHYRYSITSSKIF